jgi:hypothetical protein
MSGYSDMDELPFCDWREANDRHVTDVTYATQQRIVFPAIQTVNRYTASLMGDVKQFLVIGGPGSSGRR